MTVKEKIIKRLNEGFNLSINKDIPWHTHMKTGWADAMSWGVSKYMCNTGATMALTWDRWVITDDNEIIEYLECDHDTYLNREYRIENK